MKILLIILFVILYMYKYLRKSKKFINSINIILIIYIMTLYFKDKIIVFGTNVFNMFSNIVNDQVKNFFINFWQILEENSYIILIVSGIELLCYWILVAYEYIQGLKQKHKYKKEIILNKEEKQSRLYKNMYEYFSNDNDNDPILITGAWGAGKTKTVDDFFEKYYKYKKQKIYRISCFGISDKDVLINRIKEICKKEDTSFIINCLSIIKQIPIIGNFLEEVLLPKYNFYNLKKNSIFIFDNFERIDTYIKDNNFSNKKEILSKYNNVTGVINELIEQYKMKVLIIANEEEMVEDYVYETLICKLDCKKFIINSKEICFLNIYKDVFSKLNKEYKDIISQEELDIIINITEDVWRLIKCKNLRVIRKIFYNYTCFIDYLIMSNYKFDIVKKEKIGIFFTMLILSLININEESDLKYIFSNIECLENIASYLGKNLRTKDNYKNFETLCEYDYFWYSTKLDEIELWSYAENYYNDLIYRLEIYNYIYEEREWEPLTIFNYKNINKIKKKILWEDLVYILSIDKSFINDAIYFIKNRRVYIENKNITNDFDISVNHIVSNLFYTVFKFELFECFFDNNELNNEVFVWLEELFGEESLGSLQINSLVFWDKYKELYNKYKKNKVCLDIDKKNN